MPPASGLPALREAIAEYLHLHRGVKCSADRVLILNSTQQAINLTARLLLDAGDRVWVEDPGYVGARSAFQGARLRLHPVPVDDDGMDVARGVEDAPDARLAYVTPSHQYPMGVTLPLSRRLKLLEWSARADAWIFEDDYDSEMRHEGRPLASIQGIDEGERVLYAGTFNKILFPGLRLAYLVLPPRLVEPFAHAKEITDGPTSPLLQGVLADFMGEGHFSVHIRRVRDTYRERRDVFVKLAEELLPDFVKLGPAEAGTHIALHLPQTMDDARISDEARRLDLALPSLSRHAVESPLRGLLVHYGHAPPVAIEDGVRALGGLLWGARGWERGSSVRELDAGVADEPQPPAPHEARIPNWNDRPGPGS
jgi:GntR family transcriptional regulator/MocR family aminotransferase